MIILQISPEFGAGTGVGGVAEALEDEWRALGHDVRRFGPHEAGCGSLSSPGPGLRGRLRLAGRVVWFSTVGTVRARRVIRGLPPGSVTVCHNDALAGDVYINHGLLTTAMKARGRFIWRMARNPLHLFTSVRDRYRYRTGVHRVVVSLSEADRRTLTHHYGLSRRAAVVIPNGVHLDRYSPASPAERSEARRALGIPQDVRVAVFVGHEYDRKGLPLLLGALIGLPDHHAVVVGGTAEQVRLARKGLAPDLASRVHWLGRRPDAREALSASDVLVLPSAYEANPLVVLEALAAGLQVVTTPVGSVPELLTNDEVSRIVERTAEGVQGGLAGLAAADLAPETVRDRARSIAATQSWDLVAAEYLKLFERIGDKDDSSR